uniref:Uncharacterized protein n=1 Tax=Anguilla anguilla TaxID=7936 RepID=A0A0E9SIQ6_ANGAN
MSINTFLLFLQSINQSTNRLDRHIIGF